MASRLRVDTIQTVDGKVLYSQTSNSAQIGDATLSGTSITLPRTFPVPPSDYSDIALTPTRILPHTDGHYYAEGSAVNSGQPGGDIDYFTFRVGRLPLTALYLSYYNSVDNVGFFAIQQGSQWTAGQTIAQMLNYSHIGPSTPKPQGSNLISGYTLQPNTDYTVWVQQTGSNIMNWAISTNPLYQGTVNSEKYTFQNLTVGNRLTIPRIRVNTRLQFGANNRAALDVGSATDALLPPVGTTAQRPSLAENGQIRYNTTEGKIEGLISGSWKTWNLAGTLGTTEAQAASSAAAILAVDPTAPNGVYWLNHGSGAYQAYCYMTAGGYILVAKVASTTANNTSWSYNGSNWGSTTAVNESTCTDIGAGDGLNRGYYGYTTTTGFLFSLGSFSNTLQVSRSGVTARNAFTGGQFNMDGMSRSQFMSWINTAGTNSNNWDNQPHCNRIGFNRTDSSATAMRFGITMNNENDCNSNDSAIGFGTYTNNDTGGTRNIPAGGHRWNGDQKFPHQGYIFVK